MTVEVGKKWLITGYILKVEPKRCHDMLKVGCEREESRISLKVYP